MRVGTLPFTNSTVQNPAFLWSVFHFGLAVLRCFLFVFNAGFFSWVAALMSLASWAANRALNLLRASSVASNVYFLLVQNRGWPSMTGAATVLHFHYARSVAKTTEPVRPKVFRRVSTSS